MRQYFQIFFGLLIPLTGLFIIVSTGYFSIFDDEAFNKAIKLGMLAGVVIGFCLSIVMALFILIARFAQGKEKILTQKEEREIRKKERAIAIKEKHIIKKEPSNNGFVTEKFMLLMDKTLAYEISEYIIKKQNLKKEGHHENFKEGFISIKTINEFIKIHINSLTKHTVEFSMEYKENSVNAPIMLEYIKEKENSFLKYQ